MFIETGVVAVVVQTSLLSVFPSTSHICCGPNINYTTGILLAHIEKPPVFLLLRWNNNNNPHPNLKLCTLAKMLLVQAYLKQSKSFKTKKAKSYYLKHLVKYTINYPYC